MTTLWASSVVDVTLGWSQCRLTDHLINYRNGYRGPDGKHLPALCVLFQNVTGKSPFNPASLEKKREKMLKGILFLFFFEGLGLIHSFSGVISNVLSHVSKAPNQSSPFDEILDRMFHSMQASIFILHTTSGKKNKKNGAANCLG